MFGIECADLTRRFGDHTALQNVSLRVGEGECLVLLGSNGAGKTTLMKVLATLLLPTSGRVWIHGINPVEEPHTARRMIGYVSAEERSFFGRLTALENLKFFGALQGLSAKACRRRIEALLPQVGLEGRDHTRFGEFSSGMRQSLSLARGLLHRPKVLLLDEPTRSLSPDLAHRVQRFLKDLIAEERCTALFATHNLAEAESVADRLAILHEGRLVAEGTLASLGETADHDPFRLKEVFQRAIHPMKGRP